MHFYHPLIQKVMTDSNILYKKDHTSLCKINTLVNILIQLFVGLVSLNISKIRLQGHLKRQAS